MAKPTAAEPTLLREQKYELVRIDAVQPHFRNARQGDVGAIVESIRANQWYGACVVQRSTGNILVHNHAWMAARECGLEEIPVIWVDCDDAEALRILLVDNRTNDLAAYDENKLAEMLQEIQAEHGALDGTGFDLEALDDLLRGLEPCASSDEAEGDGAGGPTDSVTCPKCGHEFSVGVGVKTA